MGLRFHLRQLLRLGKWWLCSSRRLARPGDGGHGAVATTARGQGVDDPARRAWASIPRETRIDPKAVHRYPRRVRPQRLEVVHSSARGAGVDRRPGRGGDAMTGGADARRRARDAVVPRAIAATLAVWAFLGCASPSRAWWDESHAIIAAVATERLTPTAAAAVSQLLEDDPPATPWSASPRGPTPCARRRCRKPTTGTSSTFRSTRTRRST